MYVALECTSVQIILIYITLYHSGNSGNTYKEDSNIFDHGTTKRASIPDECRYSCHSKSTRSDWPDMLAICCGGETATTQVRLHANYIAFTVYQYKHSTVRPRIILPKLRGIFKMNDAGWLITRGWKYVDRWVHVCMCKKAWHHWHAFMWVSSIRYVCVWRIVKNMENRLIKGVWIILVRLCRWTSPWTPHITCKFFIKLKG